MPKKRRTRRRRRGRGTLGRLMRPLSVVLAAVAVVAALTLFFKVDEVRVTGCGRYSPEEVKTASGVERGDNLILLDKYGAAEKIYTDLPYITEVRLKQEFPDTLLIEVVETRAAAAIQGSGAYWLIDEGGKVLEMVEAPTAADYFQIKGVEAVGPSVGGRLTLPEESQIDAEGVAELLKGMSERNMLGRADSLDAGDPETLTLNYDGRFQVKMPYNSSFTYKLDCLSGVVEHLEPNERGVIRMDMDDDKEIRFIPYGDGAGQAHDPGQAQPEGAGQTGQQQEGEGEGEVQVQGAQEEITTA